MTASIQTKSNKYYVVLNWMENGKRKQKWINTNLSIDGNNKRKAEKKRVEVLQEWEEKLSAVNHEDILFSDYLSKWLEETKCNISESTYSIYKMVIDGVICPYFAELGIKLSDLKTFHIQDFYTYKMKHDGISPNTIYHYHANIHKSLQYAVKTERIKNNPADNVELPKKKKYIADFYTADELKELIQAAKGTKIETVIYLAAWFGLRRGEICGLRWSSINFENKTLSVNGTLSNDLKYSNSAKTDTSIRTFPLTDEAVNYLQELKERQDSNRKRLKKHYNSDWLDYVCVKVNGDIIKPDFISRQVPLLCKRNGLRIITLHELRHSNISMLVASGASMKEIQIWAGHSDFSTTANIYSHIQEKSKIKLSESISSMLSE